MASFDLATPVAGGFTLGDLRKVLKFAGADSWSKDYFEARFMFLRIKDIKTFPMWFYGSSGKLSHKSILFWVSNGARGLSKTNESLLKSAQKEAGLMLAACVEQEFLEIDDGYYCAMTKGNSLRNQSLMKRKTRAEAEKLMSEFLQRVDEFNALDLGSKVARVYVFGSYLTDSETLGDLDIAVLYSRVRINDSSGRTSTQLDAQTKRAIRQLRKTNFVSIFDVYVIYDYVVQGMAQVKCLYRNDDYGVFDFGGIIEYMDNNSIKSTVESKSTSVVLV